MVSKAKKEKKKRKLSSARKTAEKGSTFERTALNVPEGVKFFKPKKEGIYRLDLIPYEVGKGNPNAEPGVVHYERTFFVHRGIGPNNDSYICPRKNSGKKCPICEHRAKLLRDPDANEDEVKALAEKKRQLFRVINHAERDAGIQLWDESYHLFGKHLDKKIKSADDEDQEKYDNFHDPETGLMLKVNVSEENGGGYTFYDAGDIEFKERREQYDESIIDEGPNLDELIKELSYAELKKIFLQTEDDEDEDEEEEDDDTDSDDEDEDEEDDEKPAKGKGKGKPKKKDEEDDEDEDEDEDEESDDDEDEDEESECPVKVGDLISWEYKGKGRKGIVTKINTKAETFAMKSDDRSEPYTIDWDDEDVKVLKKEKTKKGKLDLDDDDEDEDEKPKKKTKPKKEEEDDEEEESDDDDEDSDDEDDKPAPKKKGKGGKKVTDDEDEDDDIPFDDDEEDEEDEEDDEDDKDDEEEKKPVKKSKKK